MNLVPQDGTIVPAQNEDSFPVNYELPLGEVGQSMLFRRIRLEFVRTTGIVTEVRDKKKYRMKEEALLALRNNMAFWDQVREFCRSRLADFDAFEEALASGSLRDSELAEVLDQCPRVFAVSMLSSRP